MAILSKYDFSTESAIKDSLFLEISSIYDTAKEKGTSAENLKEKISFKEMSSQFWGVRMEHENRNGSGRLKKTGEENKKSDGGMYKG